MDYLLDTIRIFRDEDTLEEREVRLVMHYGQLQGPIEDMSYMWPDRAHVTGFRDDLGELFMVLEPMQKVVDGWVFYLERVSHNPITFSSQ